MATSPTVGAPMRKKRNFKALQLSVSQPKQSPNSAPAEGGVPMPTRLAPPPRGKKKPPVMDLSKTRSGGAPVSASTETPEDASVVLTIGVAGSSSAPATGTPASRANYQSTLQQQLADLDINGTSGEGSAKIELKSEDLKELSELGQGAGGSVKKVVHVPTGKKMAKKVCPHCG
jgi:mitogen-activated protein kinase kinase